MVLCSTTFVYRIKGISKIQLVVYYQCCVLTTLYYGLPVVLASLASSEVVNLESIVLLILLCIWLLMTCLFIKCFKIDPLRKGCFVLLGHGSTPLSPVVSLVNYPHLHGLSPGPLFLYQDSTPLSRSKLSAFLKSTLQSNFSGHSFWVGTATTAASRGIPDHLNKTMGCWSSKTYLLYVQTPADTIVSVAGWLA